MSERTARSTIEAFFAALNASDMEAALALLSEDVILDTREGSREIGRDRFHWYWGMLARHLTERYADIEIMEAPGGFRAAAEVTFTGTYTSTREGLPEASGQSYSVPGGMFFEVEDGVITRVTTYINMENWKAALASGR